MYLDSSCFDPPLDDAFDTITVDVNEGPKDPKSKDNLRPEKESGIQ